MMRTSHSLLPDLPLSSPVRVGSMSLGQSDDLEHFRLIGECYVDGRMDGEALYIDEYRQTERDFILV